MKIIITFTILLLVLSLSDIAAQSNEVFPPQISTDHNEAVQMHSQRYVTSLYDNGGFANGVGSASTNFVDIVQFGVGNITDISQNGAGNFVNLSLIGNSNRTGIFQDGNFNSATILLSGNNNEFDLLQIGDNNIYNTERNHNGARSDLVIQEGDNLNINISGQGVPLNIEQRGNGASVIIENY